MTSRNKESETSKSTKQRVELVLNGVVLPIPSNNPTSVVITKETKNLTVRVESLVIKGKGKQREVFPNGKQDKTVPVGEPKKGLTEAKITESLSVYMSVKEDVDGLRITISHGKPGSPPKKGKKAGKIKQPKLKGLVSKLARLLEYHFSATGQKEAKSGTAEEKTRVKERQEKVEKLREKYLSRALELEKKKPEKERRTEVQIAEDRDEKILKALDGLLEHLEEKDITSDSNSIKKSVKGYLDSTGTGKSTKEKKEKKAKKGAKEEVTESKNKKAALVRETSKKLSVSASAVKEGTNAYSNIYF